MTLWDWISGDEGARAIAGFAGASVSAALEWNGLWPATRRVFIGFLAAWYLGPLATPMLSWALGGLSIGENSPATASGFLMGVVGITAIEIVVRAFRLRRDELGGGE